MDLPKVLVRSLAEDGINILKQVAEVDEKQASVTKNPSTLRL